MHVWGEAAFGTGSAEEGPMRIIIDESDSVYNFGQVDTIAADLERAEDHEVTDGGSMMANADRSDGYVDVAFSVGARRGISNVPFLDRGDRQRRNPSKDRI